jgi:hypothetical protein
LGAPDFQLLTQADYVLNACGRAIPPPGYRFIDLPYIIPFHFDTNQGQVGPATPFNRTISNASPALFLCKGIILRSDFQVRLKWPTGRFLSYSIEFNAGQEASPQGTGSTMFCFDTLMPIDPDGRVSVQISALNGGNSVDLDLVGVLRYFIADTSNPSAAAGAADVAASCIIGYPTLSKGNGAGLDLIANPIATLKQRPRYLCGPNQNIMAPEWALGDQCTAETPAGYIDEPFTFFSDPIVIPANGEVYDVPVIVPGSGETVVIHRLRFFVSYPEEFFSVPVIQIRLPNGYSLMGGDMIPCVYDQDFIPNVFELPVFPTIACPPGMRLIVDAADMLVSGEGSATLTIQFDAKKRRKAAA